jgi:RNA polymerase sigma factor FliA
MIVRDFARRIPSHVYRNDLLSAGNFALVQAAQTFDPSRGVPFERYASRRIRGALLDELRSYDWASRNVRATERTIAEAYIRLAAQTGQAPDDEALAAETGLSVEEIVANRGDVSRAAVHSADVIASAGTSVAETIMAADLGPEESLLRREKMLLLVEAIRILPPRHRQVIEDHYFRDRPMIETAEDLGVSDSRISQMRSEAVKMLHDAIDQTLSHGLDTRPALSIPSGETRQGLVQWRRRMAYVEQVAASYRATSPLLPRRPVQATRGPEQECRVQAPGLVLTR